jgi:hypothetical protein
MPIMAAHGRSDARGTARLLATMTLASIDKPKVGEPEEVALNNMFRLLQSFRKDAFFGQEVPRDSRPQSTAEKLTLRPPVERNVREVKEALEQATAIAFEGRSKDDAIEAVESVLRWIAYPRKSARPSDIDRARTASFFRELIDRL